MEAQDSPNLTSHGNHGVPVIDTQCVTMTRSQKSTATDAEGFYTQSVI